MRSDFTRRGKYLARKRAREGMRFCRKFGYLQRYKQRKCRDYRDPTDGLLLTNMDFRRGIHTIREDRKVEDF